MKMLENTEKRKKTLTTIENMKMMKQMNMMKLMTHDVKPEKHAHHQNMKSDENIKK